ncbi:hypothetical protein [Tardiphaga sp. P5_C10]
MIDLDKLEKIWPLITLHPWEFLQVLVVGVLLGIGGHKMWVAIATARPGKSAALPKKRKEKTILSIPLPFRPSELQVECVRVLRYFDDTWISASQISQKLAMVTPPKGDIRQALEGLVEREWATDQLSSISEPRYRLKGEGLQFAQKRKFPVCPEIDRPRP